MVIGPMAERPARIASQIAGASVPSPQMPPMPVMTIRGRAISQAFFAISARTASTMSPTFLRLLQASTVFISISMP